MKRALFVLTSLISIASPVHAHVSNASLAQHATEHVWLVLLLLPVAVVGVTLRHKRG